jgi:hypothetical protein
VARHLKLFRGNKTNLPNPHFSSPAGVLGTSLGSNCKLKRAAVYVRRRPERSAAYQVVRENLETGLAERRAGRLVAGANWVIDPVPGYVERDLRKF